MEYSLEESIEQICRKFQIEGKFERFEQITCGHINTTYKVFFERDGEVVDYILQKFNLNVFKKPREVMRNIISVLHHIRTKRQNEGQPTSRFVLHYRKTTAGNHYFYTAKKDFWRCCRFIDGSVTYLTAENTHVMEEAGRAYGKFLKDLADFPVDTLHIAIPHFHNTIMRFDALKEAISRNEAGRVDTAKEEIEGFLALEKMAIKAYEMQQAGILPLRVTHNDTKCSNILFDKETDEALAVIDLDTVMPGLVAFDFGDAIRAGASTADEDEKDLSKVHLDMEKFESFTKGFVEELNGHVTMAELESLPLGAIAMSLECGARFLTDYLNGDTYFRVEYPTHNLVRCRTQLQLGKEMIERLDEMNLVVKKYIQ